MIREALQSVDQSLMSALSVTSLLMFAAIFVTAALYAWTRPRKQLDDWSRIPLSSGEQGDEGDEPQMTEDRP